MRISQAWVIYIAAVLIAYIIFSLIPQLCTPVKWLLAFIVGLIVFLAISPKIRQLTPADITWYKTLLVVAYGAAILSAIWAVLSYNTGNDAPGKACVAEKVFNCSGGVCELVSEGLNCSPQGRGVFVHK